MKHFPRPALAAELADRMSGKSVLTNPFVFLAAPRRVGKSEFLRNDLMPACTNLRWITVYVDLWKDRNAPPLSLIQKALWKEAEKHLGLVQQLARKAGTTEVGISAGIGSFKFDPNRMQIGVESTIEELMAYIMHRTSMPLLLIVDEAQHALNSDDGTTAMFTLKACREEFNQSPEWQEHVKAKYPLMCVMTGSHRDKLARLCTAKQSPFYGSSVDAFALLNREYVEFFVNEVRENTGGKIELDVSRTNKVFDLLGRRPELLAEVVGKAILAGQLETLDQDIQDKATKLLGDIDGEMEESYLALTPLQQAVFEVVATGDRVSPYAQSSLEAYAAKLGAPVTAQAAQAAIEGLRNADLLWKPAKGDYQLEDTAYRAWFQRRNSVG